MYIEQQMIDALRSNLINDEEYADKFFTKTKYLFILGDLAWTIRSYQNKEMDRQALQGVMDDVQGRLFAYKDETGELPMESFILAFRIGEILTVGMDTLTDDELENMADLAELIVDHDFSELLESKTKTIKKTAGTQQARAEVNG